MSTATKQRLFREAILRAVQACEEALCGLRESLASERQGEIVEAASDLGGVIVHLETADNRAIYAADLLRGRRDKSAKKATTAPQADVADAAEFERGLRDGSNVASWESSRIVLGGPIVGNAGTIVGQTTKRTPQESEEERA